MDKMIAVLKGLEAEYPQGRVDWASDQQSFKKIQDALSEWSGSTTVFVMGGMAHAFPLLLPGLSIIVRCAFLAGYDAGRNGKPPLQFVVADESVEQQPEEAKPEAKRRRWPWSKEAADGS